MQSTYFLSETQGKVFTLDPRTKLFVMLMINLPAFIAEEWYIMAFAAAVPLSVQFLRGHRPASLAAAVIYALALFCDVIVSDALHGAAGIAAVMVSGMICRMMPGFLMGYILISTTTVSEFIASMERMHVPQQIIIPLCVMFRFFPTIKEESASISSAMKMRGISFGSTRGRLGALIEYRVVPLFISCVRIGEELSAAALTRGLGSPAGRTNVCKIGFGKADCIYFFLSAAVSVLFLLHGGRLI